MTLALLAIATGHCAVGAEILGKKPEYLQEAATGFANEGAILRRIWMPGLDEGYVPQGLAIVERHLLVSAYRSADRHVDKGPCRVFRIEMETGKDAGFFDMPPTCTHPGGLVHIGGGILVFSDEHYLWRIDSARAFASGQAQDGIRGTVKLGGDLHAEFLAFDGTDLWAGTYTVRKDADKAKMHRVPLKVFDSHDGHAVDERQALEVLPSPPIGQGAAFEGKDRIWLAASTSVIGWLHVLDRRDGRPLARHDTITGIEGLAFDAQGHLWAVSEAGAKKYLHWKQYFPMIFEIDVARLR